MIKLKKKKYRKIKLYFVISGRSDYGPSSGILKKIAKDNFFSLYICLTLSGLANKNVEKEITEDGLRIKKKIKFKHKILSNSISYLISLRIVLLFSASYEFLLIFFTTNLKIFTMIQPKNKIINLV
jgi:hypothetical protein